MIGKLIERKLLTPFFVGWNRTMSILFNQAIVSKKESKDLQLKGYYKNKFKTRYIFLFNEIKHLLI